MEVCTSVLASFHSPDLEFFSETEEYNGEIYCRGFEGRRVTEALTIFKLLLPKMNKLVNNVCFHH